MLLRDLGRLPYREAWAIQERAHADVLEGAAEQIFVMEHPPVITFGRRPGGEKHLLSAEAQLQSAGVELVQSDRGGDITFHGPGQIVVYPIVRLADHQLSVSGYVHSLETAVISTLAQLGVAAHADPKAVGVWTCDKDAMAKICAIGVRIRRGVSLHGLALNIETDLRYFDLIVPCGLAGRPVTSLRKLLGDSCPPVDRVKWMLTAQLARAFGKSAL